MGYCIVLGAVGGLIAAMLFDFSLALGPGIGTAIGVAIGSIVASLRKTA